MQLWELFFIAVGLSMDAFAVSVCKGLSVSRVRMRHRLSVGLYFGGFQALMPLIGYLLGSQFQQMITSVDHWIAFVLLVVIGINMIREARGDAEEVDASFGAKSMFPLAIATSIDALAVGVTLAFLQVNILASVSLINHLCAVHHRSYRGKSVRCKIQIQGRDSGRYCSDCDGNQNSCGTFGNFLIKRQQKIGFVPLQTDKMYDRISG